MKKYLFTFYYCLFTTFYLNAQTNTFPTTGNVGIGTTTPTSKLHLFDTSSTGLRIESSNMSVELQSSVWGADLQLGRFQTDRFAGVIYANSKTFGISKQWFAGIRGGDSDYHIFSETGLFTAFKVNQTSGNVSIGNTNNTYKLDVTGIGRFTNGLRVNLGSSIVKDTAVSSSNIGQTSFGSFIDSTYFTGMGILTTWDGTYNDEEITFHTHNGGISVGERMRINKDGNVGIGTTTPDEKLSVNGNIHTKEVRVDLVGWSDFVFAKDYNLPTLKDVELHIKEKGHLKDIPSATEVTKNGIFLGEMNAKLLQKIEELTLYTIQQQKLIEEQSKLIKVIQEKLK